MIGNFMSDILRPGPIPPIEELKVTPYDDPVGYLVANYSGFEIHHYVKDCKDPSELPSIKNEGDIKEDDKVFVSFIGGWAIANIKKDSYGVFYAEDEGNIYSLKFNEDDRHCWTCASAFNKKAIKVIK
jgi:hypothetical protein